MVRILFVCHGNICRSTMAEFVMRDMVKRRGMGAGFEIASAATSAEEIGNPVHPGTRRKLAEHGIGCEGKRAVRITRSDYDRYDRLLGMDELNLRNMRRFFGGDPAGKLARLLDCANRPRDIRDPWYTGNFEETWEDVCEGCEALLAEIEEGCFGACARGI